jgi:hypothetical protein
MNFRKLLLCAAGFVALSTASASASSYSFSVFEATTGFGPQNAQPVTVCPPTPTNAACATFTYTGPLNFDNPAPPNSDGTGDLNSVFFSPGSISGYSGNGTVTYNSQVVANFNNLTAFMASSGSAAPFAYASFYAIDLGTLAAGTILTITHDDGITLYENGAAFGSFTTGPTTAITESAKVGTTGDITLYYTRQNGTPSILQVAVPEPASLAVFGVALIAMAGAAGWMRRDRKSA